MELRPIGRTGIIKHGEYEGWFIKIEPSGDSAFLVLISKNNFLKGGDGFNNWVEEKDLQKYFEETGWDIAWSDLTYDEKILKESLEKLHKRFRTIFALACAQRLFSSYCEFDPAGRILDKKFASGIVENLWNDLLNDSMSLTKNDSINCTDMVIALKDNESEGMIAENAMAAIAYAVRYHTNGSDDEVVLPARREMETIDSYLAQELSIDFGDRNAEKTLASHPLMQRVLELQNWDLIDLREPSYDYVAKTSIEVGLIRERKIQREISRICDRAIRNGGVMFKL